MTSPLAGTQRRRSGPPVLAFVLIALVVAGAVVGGFMFFRGNSSDAATNPSASSDRLHVTDLMARANCAGGVIGTQLYSYETGRCNLNGSRVTIAVFETGEQRDQWLASARQFGGTLVAGIGWAAGMDRPDAAPLLVATLGGQVV